MSERLGNLLSALLLNRTRTRLLTIATHADAVQQVRAGL
jgi:hypothetical protein